MSLAAIRKKASDGSLEVEHLLREAKKATPGLAEELRSLARELNWPLDGRMQDGSLVVPLGAWAEAVALYTSGGLPALQGFARDPGNATYVLALLEELKSAPAVEFLVDTFAGLMASPERDLSLSVRIASALNLMLSLRPRAPISNANASIVQGFLLRLYPVARNEAERAIAVLALRGVGDASAIALLTRLPELAPPWEGAVSSTIRAIKKRRA
jgi:hypothetical protein